MQDAWSLRGIQKPLQTPYAGWDVSTKVGNGTRGQEGDDSQSPASDIGGYAAAEIANLETLQKYQKPLLRNMLPKPQKQQQKAEPRQQKGPLVSPPPRHPFRQQQHACQKSYVDPSFAGALQHEQIDPHSGVQRDPLQPKDALQDEDALLSFFKPCDTSNEDQVMGEAGQLSLQELFFDPESDMEGFDWASDLSHPKGNSMLERAGVEQATAMTALFHSMSHAQLRFFVITHPEIFKRLLSCNEVGADDAPYDLGRAVIFSTPHMVARLY